MTQRLLLQSDDRSVPGRVRGMFYNLPVGLQKNAAAAAPVAFEGTEGRARGRVRTAFGVGPDRLRREARRHSTVCGGGGGGVFVLRR